MKMSLVNARAEVHVHAFIDSRVDGALQLSSFPPQLRQLDSLCPLTAFPVQLARLEPPLRTCCIRGN